MYNPSPFLITTAALTSIFNFFFGEYFREREAVYNLWIQIIAYGKLPSKGEYSSICSRLEAKERIFRQGKAFLLIMIITLIGAFVVFQFYSMDYIDPTSPIYQPDAPHKYVWFSAIIGVIVLINCIELTYVQLAVNFVRKFPFVKFRKRVAGTERLSMIWQVLDCPNRKREQFGELEIPAKFYKDLKDPEKAFKGYLDDDKRRFSLDSFFRGGFRNKGNGD